MASRVECSPFFSFLKTAADAALARRNETSVRRTILSRPAVRLLLALLGAAAAWGFGFYVLYAPRTTLAEFVVIVILLLLAAVLFYLAFIDAKPGSRTARAYNALVRWSPYGSWLLLSLSLLSTGMAIGFALDSRGQWCLLFAILFLIVALNSPPEILRYPMTMGALALIMAPVLCFFIEATIVGLYLALRPQPDGIMSSRDAVLAAIAVIGAAGVAAVKVAARGRHVCTEAASRANRLAAAVNALDADADPQKSASAMEAALALLDAFASGVNAGNWLVRKRFADRTVRRALEELALPAALRSHTPRPSRLDGALWAMNQELEEQASQLSLVGRKECLIDLCRVVRELVGNRVDVAS